MSDNDWAEAVARRFHEVYERLAPLFGYETRPASAVPWEQVPEDNRALMVRTVEEAFENARGPSGTIYCAPDEPVFILRKGRMARLLDHETPEDARG